ncbi:FUCTA-like protein [Mya arenaria]|uniref:Fucosyltransferase n=1 Tax=Mya arenaria TaxID=6604 RepID=A0ABY7FZZ7_MYAAR|nr:FUCTA-like protein [Mya arenaria]
MDLDFYGSCGNLSCDKGEGNNCFKNLHKEYKFYLSFENANCRDYITEKFFLNALRHDFVPVVMGAHPDDYRRVAPPGSFIHVEDFPHA